MLKPGATKYEVAAALLEISGAEPLHDTFGHEHGPLKPNAVVAKVTFARNDFETFDR